MNNCNCYPLPDNIDSCFETMIVYVPVDYTDQTMTLFFKNGQGISFISRDLEVVAGAWVEVDLTGLPDGYFNPFGGPYTLQLYDESGIQVEFKAKDGITYNCIAFKISNAINGNPNAAINAFTNQVEQPY